MCNIKAVSFTYPLENFTLDWFFYTTSGCDGCDKYEVWYGDPGEYGDTGDPGE